MANPSVQGRDDGWGATAAATMMGVRGAGFNAGRLRGERLACTASGSSSDRTAAHAFQHYVIRRASWASARQVMRVASIALC